tara:strand:- start:7 stop:393 length:387 start_codon:yes stop_codon:yes gene_type:complete
MTKKRGYKIKLIDWGIAYASGDINDGTIEINRKLKKYPKLLKKVMEHEIKHLKYPSFWDTVKIEFKDMFDFEKQRHLSNYLRKNPSMSFQASMPIWYNKKQGISYNLFLLVFYALTLSMAYLFMANLL